jgi:hypothetical protein
MFAGIALLAAAVLAAVFAAIGVVVVDIRRLSKVWFASCGCDY